MKVYLDDVRETPEGWTRAYWASDTIELLKNNDVTELSLDHDLGDDTISTGYDVLLWIEEQVWNNKYKPPISIKVHSANPPAKRRMENAIKSIYDSYYMITAGVIDPT